jgi:CRISPR/Cas system CMR subunit Cmr6 (Cas7 group RAMP superfamily)
MADNYKCVRASSNKAYPESFKPRDKIQQVYIIDAQFITKNPTCTCTGEAEINFEKRKVTYKGYTVNGKPAIMGSSIKGALNAYALMLSSPEKVGDLFGFSELEGRVYFKDSIVNTAYKELKLGRQWRPRRPCRGIRVYTPKSPSPTPEEIYFQAIPPNIPFSAEIVLINGDNDDLKLLIASMGATAYGIKLGRGKDRGYGIIKLNKVEVTDMNGNKLNAEQVIKEAKELITQRWNNVSPAFFT